MSDNVAKQIVFRILYQKVFRCKNCGLCCQDPGMVAIHDSDVESIASYLGIERKKFYKKYTKRVKNPVYSTYDLSILKTDPCMFYEAGIGCKIHKVKPKACIAFPFLTGFGPELGDKVIKITMNCPGAIEVNEAFQCAKAGELDSHPEYQQIILEASDIFERLQDKGLIDDEGNITSFDIFRELNFIEELLGFKNNEDALKWLRKR